MGLPEQQPVRPPFTDTRRGSLFSQNTPSSPEIIQKEHTFYEVITNRWKSFLEKGMTRRAFLRASGRVGFGAFGASLVVAGFHPEQVELGLNWLITNMQTPDTPLTIPENAEKKVKKAMTLYNNMITQFGTHTELMLEESREHNSRYSLVWPYTRAIDATYAMSFVQGVEHEPVERYKAMLGGLEEYWSDKPAGHKPGYDPGLPALNSYYVPILRPFVDNNGPDRYVDDNLWIGHILMREYWQTKDKQLLYRARQVFDLAVDQWDHVQGGIYWKQQFDGERAHGRGIVSNAPAIMLGVELDKALYSVTGDEKCLQFCDVTYAWIQRNLKDDTDGLYYDNKDYTGVVGKEKFTYCQGVMIGAMGKLHEIDPVRYTLDNAITLANNSLTYFDRLDNQLKNLSRKKDPSDVVSEGYEDLAYTGIYFANLLYLSAKLNNADFTMRVQDTLQRIVSRLYSKHDTLLDQAGAVHLAALNCMEEKDYGKLYESPLFVRT